MWSWKQLFHTDLWVCPQQSKKLREELRWRRRTKRKTLWKNCDLLYVVVIEDCLPALQLSCNQGVSTSSYSALEYYLLLSFVSFFSLCMWPHSVYCLYVTPSPAQAASQHRLWWWRYQQKFSTHSPHIGDSCGYRSNLPIRNFLSS